MVVPFAILGAVAAFVLYETIFAGPKKPKAGKKPAGGAPPAKNPLPPGVSWKGLTYVPPPPSMLAAHPGLIALDLGLGGGAPQVDPASVIATAAQNLINSTMASPGSMGILAHQMVTAYLKNLAGAPTPQNLASTVAKLRASSLAPEGSRTADALEIATASLSHTGYAG